MSERLITTHKIRLPTCCIRGILQVKAEKKHVADLRNVQGGVTVGGGSGTANVLFNTVHQLLLQSELHHVEVKGNTL